jgi:uncharacterized protein YllA (UPF0747 family)
VDPVVQRLMARVGVGVRELSRPRDQLETDLARRQVPAAVSEALDRVREAVAAGYEAAIEGVRELDPSTGGALGRLRNEVLHRVAESERKVVQGVKRRESATLAQLDRILASLRPEGKPQDRVLNIVPFYARYGPRLLEGIAEALDPGLEEEPAGSPTPPVGLGA